MRKIYSGKVRDIYEIDGFEPRRLLMAASDRVSAFDVVMSETVPRKGQILTAMSCFWMERTSDIVPNHLIDPFPSWDSVGEQIDSALIGRSVVVEAAEMIQLECIVRGYLAGSAYKEYKAFSTVHGQHIEPGLPLAAKLNEPVFCPSSKNHLGHDENISIEQARERFSAPLVEELARISLEIYHFGVEVANDVGIILADTKFEFGFVNGEIVLCDEVLTPDSSRFWDGASYAPGVEPIQYDKQPLRNYLDLTDWAKTAPPPQLPDEVLVSLAQRYETVYEKITKTPIVNWLATARSAASTAKSDFVD